MHGVHNMLKNFEPSPPPKKGVPRRAGALKWKKLLADHFDSQNDDFTTGWTSSIMLQGMLRK